LTPTSGNIERILSRWIDRIRPELPEGEHGEALIGSYRELGRFVLEHSLVEEPDHESLDEYLAPLLSAVARINRRSGASISSTLQRFGHLIDAVLTTAGFSDEISEEAFEALRAAKNVHVTLDYALRRLVRILEERDVRERRERADALATTMDVLSHELDNRLGAVRTATDMLDNPRIELEAEDLERVSSLIRSAIDDALKTVDDVEALIAGWGEGSYSSARTRWMPLHVLLRKLLDELEPVARDADVRLVGPTSKVDAPLDPSRLRLVLYNLVSNGIKYRDPEEDDPRVRIENERLEDGRLRIRVADNGIGIGEDDHDEVFLYQARAEDEIDGSGLGLAIAREAVDQLGGTLELESRVGEGSTFTVTLDPRS